MAALTCGSRQWDFVDAPAVERRVGAAPDTTDGFPVRWRAFGPVGAEGVRISNAAYDSTTGLRAEPRVSAAVERLARIPERPAIGSQTFEGRNFQVTGTKVAAPAAPARPAPKQGWFHPLKDTGYGTLREPVALLKLEDGRILAGILSREGRFHGPADPEARVNFCSRPMPDAPGSRTASPSSPRRFSR